MNTTTCPFRVAAGALQPFLQSLPAALTADLETVIVDLNGREALL